MFLTSDKNMFLMFFFILTSMFFYNCDLNILATSGVPVAISYSNAFARYTIC